LTSFKNASPVVAADPDGNVDNDNDAQPLSGGIVVTKAITLAYNTEPTAGTGNDTNNTLDLGFVQNQPPTISGTASSVSFTEGQAVTLSSALSVADPDNVNLANATVKITGGTFAGDGDVLSTSTTGTGITASYNSSTETLTLTGSDTLAHYQTVLDKITFSSGSNP